MHIVLVYRYYNDGIVYYNLTFCTRKSLMTDLGLIWVLLCIIGLILLKYVNLKRLKEKILTYTCLVL